FQLTDVILQRLAILVAAEIRKVLEQPAKSRNADTFQKIRKTLAFRFVFYEEIQHRENRVRRSPGRNLCGKFAERCQAFGGTSAKKDGIDGQNPAVRLDAGAKQTDIGDVMLAAGIHAPGDLDR